MVTIPRILVPDQCIGRNAGNVALEFEQTGVARGDFRQLAIVSLDSHHLQVDRLGEEEF